MSPWSARADRQSLTRAIRRVVPDDPFRRGPRPFQVTEAELSALRKSESLRGGGAQAALYVLRCQADLAGERELEISSGLANRIANLFRTNLSGGFQGRVPRGLARQAIAANAWHLDRYLQQHPGDPEHARLCLVLSEWRGRVHQLATSDRKAQQKLF